ncbi:MAG: hypothetical protein HKL96_01940 [Phycisphaerales bacterium]|nr:hypothetical protein [Phycisphaerales bacterium]
MDLRISDTFTASLARLTGDEQKAVKTTAFDLQLNPANPGMSFHRLDSAKDKNTNKNLSALAPLGGKSSSSSPRTLRLCARIIAKRP